jgi:putative ABC transport system substrate-binding protein
MSSIGAAVTRIGLRVVANILLVAACLVAVPLGAAAQPAGKVSRVGVLSTGPAGSNPHLSEAFRQGLRDLGWLEGQNIVLEYRYAEGRDDRLPALAAELVRQNPDAIVATSTASTVALSKATKTIPIVFMGAGDPVSLGLVASLGRPGGNVTGLSFSVGMETFGKGLELLREALPGIRRVAVLSNPANPGQPLAIKNVTKTAQSLGLEIQLLEARGPGDFDGAFTAMAKQRAPALLVVADAVFLRHSARIADLAAKHRLPAMHGFREVAAAGGLMAYGASMPASSRRAAVFVDKILKGAKPGDLPVEQPTKFELVINLKTAKTLGLTIPPSLLARADEVLN